MNFLNAHFDGNRLSIKNEESDLEIKLNNEQQDLLKKHKEGEYDIVIGLRPENVYLKGDANLNKDAQEIDIICDFRELLGQEVVIYTFIQGQKFLVKVSSKTKVSVDDKLIISFNKDSLYFFDKESTKRIK